MQAGHEPEDYAELVAAAVRAEPGAVDRLLRAILPLATRLCRAHLRRHPFGPVVLDDVVQETLIAVAQSIGRFDTERGAFVGYVHRIARNKIVDAYRVAGREPSRPFGAVDLADRPDRGPGPEERVLRHELSDRLIVLLGRLAERDRDILVLRIIARLPATEVGEALDMTPGAVRVAQHRALSVLRRLAGSDLRDR